MVDTRSKSGLPLALVLHSICKENAGIYNIEHNIRKTTYSGGRLSRAVMDVSSTEVGSGSVMSAVFVLGGRWDWDAAKQK